MAGEMNQLAQTKIGCAIKEADPRGLKMLLQQGEDAHFRDRKGNTYLHYVSTMNRPTVFHIIAATGIDANLQNKHGHTPLHVTALQKQSGHLADLMCWGADPSIPALDRKTPDEVNSHDQYWHHVYDKYKPGIFQAVKDHDVERVKDLLHCWCKMDSEKNGQTLRQFAAAHKHHDIVSLLDRHRATMDAIYGVLQLDYEKLKRGLKKTRCDVNFLNLASQKQHILQHAIQLRDYRLVQMLCDAGADINIHVRLKNYFRAPLYFEAISPTMQSDIMWKILKSKANFSLKDERGRNALLYALDRDRGYMSLDIFQFIIENGGNVADRDETGVTIRDTARFSRRPDIINYIDKCYVKMIRNSDLDKLQSLATDGYDSMLITYNYRDSFIYAAGNETDDALNFIEWLPTFQSEVRSLQRSVRQEPLSTVRDIIESCHRPDMLVNCRDKAMRTPLILACLFAREDIVKYLLDLPSINVNSTDCCDRSCLHYSYLLGVDGDSIRDILISAGIDNAQRDTNGRLAPDYAKIVKKEEWLEQEIHAKYGMELELLCVDKYEELYKIIRGKRKGLKDFAECIKYFPFPVSTFPKILGPLMPGFRDLIFLAIDFGKEDICLRLADIGADLFRKEKYTIKNAAGEEEPVYMTAVERSWDQYMTDVAALLSRKQEHRRHQRKSLLPKRIHSRFQEAIALKPVLFSNGEDQIGFCWMQSTIKQGERWSSYRSFIKPHLARPNLHVMPNTFTTKVIIKDKKAIGVECIRNGRKVRVFARKEVILSAGAVNSPQLLMLSGVGPKEHLKKLGIPVLADLPVGENLQDHFMIPLAFRINTTGPITGDKLTSMWTVKQYEYFRTGLWSATALEALAFVYRDLDKKKESGENSDIQVHTFSAHGLTPPMREFFPVNYMEEVKDKMFTETDDIETVSFYPVIIHPKSRGTIRLRSTDPFDYPDIDPHYLEDEDDVQLAIQSIRFVEKMVGTNTMKSIGMDVNNRFQTYEFCSEHEFRSDKFWECYVRHFTLTVYHPTSTCRMGGKDDPSAVVDPQLRVKGISGLRVVDASVMRNVPGGNTNAPSIMIGEKAADLIRKS